MKKKCQSILTFSILSTCQGVTSAIVWRSMFLINNEHTKEKWKKI